MEKKKIEEIVNQSIIKVSREYELVNANFLQALYLNIDILANNAEKWFDGDIPLEFKNVLNSLMTLTLLYFDEKKDLSNMIAEPKYQETELCTVFEDISKDINSILGIKGILVENRSKNSSVNTSGAVLREAMLNIFLSLHQFMDEDTQTVIRIEDEYSSLKVEVEFKNLLDIIPNVDKLTRTFFSYYDGSEYRVNIGMNAGIEHLKNLGTNISIKSSFDRKVFKIKFVFPTIEFLETVEEIRKSDKKQNLSVSGEEIIIMVSDIIIDMVITDSLRENGYTVKKLLKLNKDAKDVLKNRIMIIDYESIKKNFKEFKNFIDTCYSIKRIIVILGVNDEVEYPASDAVIFLKKPFEVDEIIEHLKSGIS